MAIVLAMVAAIGWGASDYFGGDASRREVPVFVVVAIAELFGAALLVPELIARGAPPPTDPRLLLAAAAGVAVTVELSLIYRALGRGQAFITAPTGALGTAAAVTVGLIGGDPLSLAVAIGLLGALLGGGISAWSSPATGAHGDIGAFDTAATCLGAAVAVGAMLTCLHAAGRLDPYWATGIEHISTSLSAAIAALIAARRPLRDLLPHRSQLSTLALVAAAGVGGDLAYTTASRTGALSITSAVASLYPITTIALGRMLQGRRAMRIQLIGIILALGGAVLLGVSTR